MAGLLSLIFPIIEPIHNLICQILWQGESPAWLTNLHELLGVAG